MWPSAALLCDSLSQVRRDLGPGRFAGIHWQSRGSVGRLSICNWKSGCRGCGLCCSWMLASHSCNAYLENHTNNSISNAFTIPGTVSVKNSALEKHFVSKPQLSGLQDLEESIPLTGTSSLTTCYHSPPPPPPFTFLPSPRMTSVTPLLEGRGSHKPLLLSDVLACSWTSEGMCWFSS